jgi:hypothetical protein
VLLSGAGVWGASRYADAQPGLKEAAAQGDLAAKHKEAAGSATIGASSSGRAPVTVPWAQTPDPGDDSVQPLVLPSQWPTESPVIPQLSSVPTIPVSVPTVGPSVSALPTATRTVRTTPAASPTPRVTVTVTPSVTPGTPKPSASAVVSTPPAAQPTPSSAPTPTRSVVQPSSEPEPSAAKTTAAPAKTKAAAPAKTTAKAAAPEKNKYTPTQVCGSGFYVQRSSSFSGGTTYQLYNTSSGQNCVVTMKTTDVGKATHVSATLEVQGGGTKTDSGNFEYYAGPVKLPAKGKCVRYSGAVGSQSTSAGWDNCG